ncbi:MAG: hypothetical protein HQK62_13860 [Desulfamplus sp.]|nr:hypothetical protein [Desulfamplus sp.]
MRKDFLILSIFTMTLFVIILSILVGFGIGIGFILHWMIPSIDIRMGTLIGLIGSALSFTATGILLFMIGSEMKTIEDEDYPRPIVLHPRTKSGKNKS